MSCDYCRHTSTNFNPCPVCEVQPTQTHRPIRKAKAMPPRQPPAIRVTPAQRSAYNAVESKDEKVRANEAKMRAISAELVRMAEAKAAQERARYAPPHVPSAPMLIARPATTGALRMGTLRPISDSDWRAGAALTLAWMRKPAQLVDSTAKEITTAPGVRRGDWAGLARAVDAGRMSDAEAIALAATWSVGVAS